MLVCVCVRACVCVGGGGLKWERLTPRQQVKGVWGSHYFLLASNYYFTHFHGSLHVSACSEFMSSLCEIELNKRKDDLAHIWAIV